MMSWRPIRSRSRPEAPNEESYHPAICDIAILALNPLTHQVIRFVVTSTFPRSVGSDSKLIYQRLILLVSNIGRILETGMIINECVINLVGSIAGESRCLLSLTYDIVTSAKICKDGARDELLKGDVSESL